MWKRKHIDTSGKLYMHEHEGHTYPWCYNLDLPPVEAIKAQLLYTWNTTSRFTRYDDLPDVITVDTGDQHLALVVVDEESSDHGGGLTQCSRAMLENWIKRRSQAVSHWMGNTLQNKDRLKIVCTLVLGDMINCHIVLSSVCEITDTQYYRANLFNYLLSFIARKWTNSSIRLKAA